MAEGESAVMGPARERPLSPHLQVWRWHATMWTSILHRATGVGLYFGALLFAFWLTAISLGPPVYQYVMMAGQSIFGQVAIWGLVFSACFHVLSGLRHLVWDVGFGFKKQNASFFSLLIIIGSVLLTGAIWFWSSTLSDFGGMPPL